MKLLVLLLNLFLFNCLASDELDRYSKCYKQFTGDILTKESEFFQQVKMNSITGAQACEKILEKGNLEAGVLKSENRALGKKVLHTFNILNNSFFSNTPRREPSWRKYQKWIYDTNDRSYYLLNALFLTQNNTPTYKFNNIFTDKNTYEGIRERLSNNNYRLRELYIWGSGTRSTLQAIPDCGDSRDNPEDCSILPFKYQMIGDELLQRYNLSYSSGVLLREYNPQDQALDISIGGYELNGNHNAYLTTFDWNWSSSEIVQEGELIGVGVRQPKFLPHSYQRAFNNSDGYWRAYVGSVYSQPYPNPVDDVNKNLGSGILFTPNYQVNLGLDTDTVFVQNGLDQVPRMWPQEIIKDFLCRDIPVIRQVDAAMFVSDSYNQMAPFRSGVSCMRCHATIDPLASISRNYQYIRTAPMHSDYAQINAFHKVTFPDEGTESETVDNFFPVRPPTGDFRYRDYVGEFHNYRLPASANNQFQSFQRLGQILSQMDDPYICLASKYFSYFTGIRPTFFDPGDPDSPLLSKRDVEIKNFVFELGKNLKESGNLRRTIMDIVSSELFIDPNSENISEK